MQTATIHDSLPEHVVLVRDHLLAAIGVLLSHQNFRLYQRAETDPDGHVCVPGNIHRDDIARLHRMGDTILRAGLVDARRVLDIRWTVSPIPINLGGGTYKIGHGLEVIAGFKVAA